MSRPHWFVDTLRDERRGDEAKGDAVNRRMRQLAREGWEDLEAEDQEDAIEKLVVITGLRETCGHCENGAELGKRDERIRELRAEIKALKSALKDKP